MGKERIVETITLGETGLELITITANNPDSPELKKLIQNLRENNPDSLILVRTPEITGPQVEALFKTGANAHRNLLPKDKK